MSNDPNDIQNQLDELLSEASEPDVSADEPVDGPAPNPEQRRPEPGGEPAATGEPVDELASEAHSAAEAAEAPAARAEDVERLDARLAEEAEGALAGEFDAVDEAAGQQENRAPDDAPPEAQGGPPPTGDPAFDEALDELVEGGADPAEQASGASGGPAAGAVEEPEGLEVAAKTATGPLHAADPPSEDAAAVAAELDADETASAADEPPAPAAEAAAEPAVAAEAAAEPAVAAAPAFGSSFWNEGEADPDKDQAGWHGLSSASPPHVAADGSGAPGGRALRPSLLALARRGGAAAARAVLIVMAATNRPIMRFPPWVRDVIGLAGVMTLFMGLGLIVYARWGALAVIAPAVLLTTAFVALFYLLFLRDPARLAEPAAEEGRPRDD